MDVAGASVIGRATDVAIPNADRGVRRSSARIRVAEVNVDAVRPNNVVGRQGVREDRAGILQID